MGKFERRVNWYGPFNKQVGFGIHSISLAHAISNRGADLHYLPLESLPKEVDKDYVKMLMKEVDLNALSVILTHGNLMWQAGCGRPRIGYTVCEVDKLPDIWVSQLNQLDDVWTVSKFCKETFENSGIKANVKIVPEGVDEGLFNPFVSTIPEITNRPQWKLLTVGKLEKRKNIEGVCQAWAKADLPEDKAELYLMIHNPFVEQNPFEFLFSLGVPQKVSRNIKLINRIPDYRFMPRLYRSMNAFISLTRGESWGLPIIEAMATGIPTIVTNASGQKDYISKDDTYLVEPKDYVKADDPIFGHFLNQGRWAEPDIDQAAELIRYLFEHQEEAEDKGIKASKRVIRSFTWEQAAATAISELEKL